MLHCSLDHVILFILGETMVKHRRILDKKERIPKVLALCWVIDNLSG